MEKRTFNRLGFGLTALVTVTLVVQVLFTLVMRFVNPDFVQTSTFTYLSTALMYPFGIPAFWLITRGLPVCPPGAKTPIRPQKTLVLFLVSFGLLSIFNLFGNLIAVLIGLLRGSAINNAVSDLLLSDNNYFMMLLVVCVLAPIFEELAFRKILLDRLRPFGDRVAILYSGIAFGLFHMNLYQLFYAAALGMVFAYVALRTNNIHQTILLHMLVNFFGSFVSIASSDLLGDAGSVCYVAFLLFTIVFAIVWLPVHRRDLRLDGPHYSFSQPITAGLVCLNIGTILFTLICVFFLVITIFFY